MSQVRISYGGVYARAARDSLPRPPRGRTEDPARGRGRAGGLGGGAAAAGVEAGAGQAGAGRAGVAVAAGRDALAGQVDLERIAQLRGGDDEGLGHGDGLGGGGADAAAGAPPGG